MSNSESARIIREARQNTECCDIDREALRFVLRSKILSDTEKLIWIFITGQASLTEPYSFFITTEQELAEKMNNTLNKVTRAIANLKKESFLEVQLAENGSLAYFPKCPIANQF
jgi:hypothetical protein